MPAVSSKHRCLVHLRSQKMKRNACCRWLPGALWHEGRHVRAAVLTTRRYAGFVDIDFRKWRTQTQYGKTAAAASTALHGTTTTACTHYQHPQTFILAEQVWRGGRLGRRVQGSKQWPRFRQCVLKKDRHFPDIL